MPRSNYQGINTYTETLNFSETLFVAFLPHIDVTKRWYTSNGEMDWARMVEGNYSVASKALETFFIASGRSLEAFQARIEQVIRIECGAGGYYAKKAIWVATLTKAFVNHFVSLNK